MGIVRKRRGCHFVIVFFLILAWMNGAVMADTGCVSSQCHGGMLNKENTHPSGKDCQNCHKQLEGQHPQQGKMLLLSSGSDTCVDCHSDVTGYAKAHAPVSQGKCFVCHDPHGSIDNELLRKNENELCSGCHDKLISAESKVLHGTIQDGVCSSCHKPHGSLFDKLLIEKYSSKMFLGYSEDEYIFCFSCHDRGLLRFSETSFATEFRDGDRNLHYLHVNREKRGKNCKLCHEIHSSKLPKLIAQSVPFGKWHFPLNFKKTKTGGSCSPGCHDLAVYDREQTKGAK